MNKRIGNKILFTYFIVLIVAFITTDIVFQELSKKYLVNEAHKQLKEEGQAMTEMLGTIPFQAGDVKRKLAERKMLKTAQQFIESDVVVLTKDRKILYKSIENIDKRILLQMAKTGDLDIRGYVGERFTILSKNGDAKGYVLLFTKVKNVYGLNRLLRGTQVVSFVVAGIIAMIIGAAFEKNLTKPIALLIGRIKGFSDKKELIGRDIKTGDEIEELDKCFREMVEKLKLYDEQQIRFLQNTSHELKTPLMSIQGYAEAIKDGVVEGKEMEESLDIIIEQSQRLKKTVEEIIYLTKLESSDEKYKLDTVSMQDCLNFAIKSIRPIAEEKRITVDTDYKSNYVGLFDEEKITRAFINILGNAVRYAESSIKVLFDDARDYIKISISDDGTGFKQGEEKQVFDRFYKGHKGNTGIGLSITKTVVEGHNGTVTASNNIPKGAVFEITLPKKQ